MSNNAVHSMSKQAIRKRMLRFAASHLGVKRIELLDPLVALFIESLAEEIYTASSEIRNIESRMLDTLSDVISPDISLSAHPAHCILHATPQDGEVVVTSDSAFLVKEKKRYSQETEQLTFYPLCSTSIRKGGIRSIIHNNLCYQIESDQSKTLVSRLRNTDPSLSQKYWIGLALDESVSSLKNLSFYFDFRGVSDKTELRRSLSHSIWRLNGRTINHCQGIHTISKEKVNDKVDLFTGFETASQLEIHMLETYADQFRTITDDIVVSEEKGRYPQELKPYLPEYILEEFDPSLIWLEIEFPPLFSTSILESMLICINAFPIINKSLYSKTVELNETLQVIPIETGNHESLLSIHSVIDSSGCLYYELPFEDTLTDQYSTYSLRRGGYERYSKREMREYLEKLVQRMESHSAAGADNTDKNTQREEAMQGVHKLIKHLKELIAKSTEKLEIQHYISIDCPIKRDVFFIKYWITNSRQANHIKQHTFLSCTDTNFLFDTSSVYTLSDTSGGKYKPQVTERRNLQLKSMTDREMLVTDKDIILFCKKNFASAISDVRIVKGVVENPNRKHEFLRTTDVVLTSQKNASHLLTESEIQQFKQHLQNNSPATYNYRIVLTMENKQTIIWS